MSSWNKIYKQSDNYKYYNLHEPYENLDLIANEFKRHKAKQVLDVGCGLGNNLLPLLKYGFDVYGIDASQEAILGIKGLLSKERKESERVVLASFGEIPFSDNSFDAVLAIQTLQHGTKEEVRQGILEIKRVLRPKGILFVTIPGRYAHKKERYCLVTTARQIEERTFIPTKGKEVGIPHHIFNKSMLLRYFGDFAPIRIWKDSKDYYCFLGKKK